MAAIVSGPAFAVRGAANQSVSLTGIEPEAYARIVRLPDKVVAGTYRITNSDMLVGQQLAADLGVGLGDRLRLVSASGASVTLNISGLVDLGSRGANQRAVYVLLSTAQNLLQLTGAVSAIQLTVRDPFQAELIAKSVANQTHLDALSWIATNNQFFLGLNAQRFTSELIRLFVGLSVAAGIASVLVVSVVQRSKDIGILRAMGGSRGQILRVFLLQGAIVGLLGSLVGSALATVLLAGWRMIAKNPDGTPDVRHRHRRPAVPAGSAGSDRHRPGRRRHAGGARRAPATSGGDPWLRTFCAWITSARPMAPARLRPPKCCTRSACGWRTANSSR